MKCELGWPMTKVFQACDGIVAIAWVAVCVTGEPERKSGRKKSRG